MNDFRQICVLLPALVAACTMLACSPRGNASGDDADEPIPQPSQASKAPAAEPPQAIRDWMDRLTVDHTYDPQTGFIVAREVITLPPILTGAPALDAAVASAGNERTVIVFATADRCAPCQQYKKDTLNDPTVIARLSDSSLLATHVEVDREPGLADEFLGGRAIPMTYALRKGERIATLRGQRSPEELLAWLDGLPDA